MGGARYCLAGSTKCIRPRQLRSSASLSEGSITRRSLRLRETDLTEHVQLVHSREGWCVVDRGRKTAPRQWRTLGDRALERGRPARVLSCLFAVRRRLALRTVPPVSSSRDGSTPASSACCRSRGASRAAPWPPTAPAATRGLGADRRDPRDGGEHALSFSGRRRDC